MTLPFHTIPYFLSIDTIVLYVINECMRDTPAAVSHTLYLSSHTVPGCVLLVYNSSLSYIHTGVCDVECEVTTLSYPYTDIERI